MHTCEHCGKPISSEAEYFPVCSRACEDEHIDRRASLREEMDFYRFEAERFCGGERIGEIIDAENGQTFEVLATY